MMTLLRRTLIVIGLTVLFLPLVALCLADVFLEWLTPYERQPFTISQILERPVIALYRRW